MSPLIIRSFLSLTWGPLQLRASSADAFISDAQRRRLDKESKISEAAVYEEVGRLRVELSWLKKKSMQLGLSENEVSL